MSAFVSSAHKRVDKYVLDLEDCLDTTAPLPREKNIFSAPVFLAFSSRLILFNARNVQLIVRAWRFYRNSGYVEIADCRVMHD